MDARLRITHHAYKRYRQRVGARSRQVLTARSQTALQCGLYKQGEGLIKLCGIWWGSTMQSGEVVLTTCYGRQDQDMIAMRQRNRALKRMHK